MRKLIRSIEMLAQIIMFTSLFGITFWSIYMVFEAFRESPWWFVAVAVTFFILLGFAVLINQGLGLIARITHLLYPRARHMDDLEVQSLTTLTAEMLDRDEEVDDWGSLHEIVEEYHNDVRLEEYHNNVRFGGDGQ